MTDDLELIRRLADGEWSADQLLAHLATTPRPSLAKPDVRSSIHEMEADADRLPLSESYSALSIARYQGKISEQDFWAVRAALWPMSEASGSDVGGTP